MGVMPTIGAQRVCFLVDKWAIDFEPGLERVGKSFFIAFGETKCEIKQFLSRFRLWPKRQFSSDDL